MSERFVRAERIVEVGRSMGLPVTRDLANQWAGFCAPLGKALPSRRDPTHKNYKVYDLPLATKALKSIRQPEDEFSDSLGNWVWLDVAARCEGVVPTLLLDWMRRAAAGDTRRVFVRYQHAPYVRARTYLRKEAVAKVVAARSHVDHEWGDAAAVKKQFGFSKNYLRRYDDRDASGRPHPLTRKRIPTRRQPRVIKRKTHHVREWYLPALREISDLLKSPPPWLTTGKDAARRLGVPPQRLLWWERRVCQFIGKKLVPEKIPAAIGDRNRVKPVRLYPVAVVEAIALAMKQQGANQISQWTNPDGRIRFRSPDGRLVKAPADNRNGHTQAAATEAKAKAETEPDDLFPADHYRLKYGLKPRTLNKARLDVRLTGYRCGGRWFYSRSAVRKLYPDAFVE